MSHGTRAGVLAMSEVLTLGSLFDGSGGFLVAAKICGIKPI